MEKKKYEPTDPGEIVEDPTHVPTPREFTNREILLRIAEKLGVDLG